MGTSLEQTYAAWTYTANGLPQTLTDAHNFRSTWEYDGHDRLLKLRYPVPGTTNSSSTTDYEQYGWDANGNPISLRRRSGRTITLAYDNLDRLTGRSYPDQEQQWHLHLRTAPLRCLAARHINAIRCRSARMQLCSSHFHP